MLEPAVWSLHRVPAQNRHVHLQSFTIRYLLPACGLSGKRHGKRTSQSAALLILLFSTVLWACCGFVYSPNISVGEKREQVCVYVYNIIVVENACWTLSTHTLKNLVFLCLHDAFSPVRLTL